MSAPVHFVAWSAQADASAACGVSGCLWPTDSDPEGLMQGGTDADPVWFAQSDHPERVTCVGCLPAAGQAIEKARAHAAAVAAAGGQEAWWADQIAHALAAAEARGQNDVPRHLRIALANAQRAFERDDFAALATSNMDLQGLVDAAMACRNRAIVAAEARGFERGRAAGPAPYVDPLADEAGNRHHKDGSRCVDPYCRRAHALPLRHLEPR